jgi:hypothetical protein
VAAWRPVRSWPAARSARDVAAVRWPARAGWWRGRPQRHPEQFQRAGFGEQARSWVGTGANQPISPDVISQVFGRRGLSQIATQAGLASSRHPQD